MSLIERQGNATLGCNRQGSNGILLLEGDSRIDVLNDCVYLTDMEVERYAASR